jgi:hypothetical protein
MSIRCGNGASVRYRNAQKLERIHPVHLAQLITYLKLTGCPAGLLMNFNAPTLHAGLRRAVHPDLFVKR